MTFLDTQKALARNEASGITYQPTSDPQTKYFFSPEKLDTLIETILTNHHTELVRVLGSKRSQVNSLMSKNNETSVQQTKGANYALDQAITLSEQLIKPAIK